MKRREFVKYSSAGLAALVVGAKVPGVFDNPVFAATAVTQINLRVTDCIKQMATHNTGVLPNGSRVGTGNPALCYFWIYQVTDNTFKPTVPADSPGPIIFTSTGISITINVKNELDEPHRFSIPRLGVTTGDIAPNAVGSVTFTVPVGKAGTYLYYDDRNAPVNRVMGLHGAFVVMPAAAPAGHRFTPYDNASPNIQQLFDDLGSASWWPGLAWDEADPATDTPPFRQYIWLAHQASPRLFAAVGNFTPGLDYPANKFVQQFLHSPFNPNHDPFRPQDTNNIPIYFTVSGQSGHFAHNNPYICPYNRVGEPVIIRWLNAGLWSHSTHIHANHVFTLQKNNRTDVFAGSFDNPIWVDVYTCNPLDTYDWLLPYMRPPDVPNDKGIGREDLQANLPVIPTPIPLYGTGGGPTPAGVTTWPPQQELDFHIPQAIGGDPLLGRKGLALDGTTVIDLGVHMSPLCFPMHDHSEPSQGCGGGNYNMGLISGVNFTGDRKGAGPGGAGVITFPMKPDAAMDLVAHGPDMRPGQSGIKKPTVAFRAPSLP